MFSGLLTDFFSPSYVSSERGGLCSKRQGLLSLFWDMIRFHALLACRIRGHSLADYGPRGHGLWPIPAVCVFFAAAATAYCGQTTIYWQGTISTLLIQ